MTKPIYSLKKMTLNHQQHKPALLRFEHQPMDRAFKRYWRKSRSSRNYNPYASSFTSCIAVRPPIRRPAGSQYEPQFVYARFKT